MGPRVSTWKDAKEMQVARRHFGINNESKHASYGRYKETVRRNQIVEEKRDSTENNAEKLGLEQNDDLKFCQRFH